MIYAPSGTVKLSAKNITINGIIIAKHVIMEASEKINIDSNPELAKFIGVDSENNPEISNNIPENKKKKFITTQSFEN